MIANFVNVGLAEWIIYATLVLFALCFNSNHFYAKLKSVKNMSKIYMLIYKQVCLDTRSVFMIQDHYGYNSVQLGITQYNSV